MDKDNIEERRELERPYPGRSYRWAWCRCRDCPERFWDLVPALYLFQDKCYVVTCDRCFLADKTPEAREAFARWKESLQPCPKPS